MNKVNKSIINHIPSFLKYCKIDKKLSSNTVKNYSQFLAKFTAWLISHNMQNITPDELSETHIKQYRTHLSRTNLNQNTQNYYLISLRVLLDYFVEKNISSILPQKVSLPKTHKQSKGAHKINLKLLEKLKK